MQIESAECRPDVASMAIIPVDCLREIVQARSNLNERQHCPMLRITVNHGQGFTRFGVEGSLTRPSAQELKKCWQEVCVSRPQSEHRTVDLTDMMNIDSIGKGILIEMYRNGVELVGSGVMTNAVIEEIMGAE